MSNRGVIPFYLKGPKEMEHERLGITPARSFPTPKIAARTPVEQNRQVPTQRGRANTPQIKETHQVQNMEPDEEIPEEYYNQNWTKHWSQNPVQKPQDWDHQIEEESEDVKPPLFVGNETYSWRGRAVGERLDNSSIKDLLLNLEPGEHCLLIKTKPIERSDNLEWLLEEGQRLLINRKCQLEDICIYTKLKLDFGLVVK